MSVCGRFWRSTALTTLLIAIDVVLLFGGLPFPILVNAYWVQVLGRAKCGLWNPDILSSRNALLCIWILRVATASKLLLVTGFAHCLNTFHSYRYSCEAERTRNLCRLLLLLSLGHLAFTVIQLTGFWAVLLPHITNIPLPLGLSKVSRWISTLSRTLTIGPAAHAISFALPVDFAAVIMTLYYRQKQKHWQKFNTDIAVFFA